MSNRGWLAIALAGMLMVFGQASSALGDESCAGGGDTVDNGIAIGVTCSGDGAGQSGPGPSSQTSDAASATYVEYKWASVCIRFDASDNTNSAVDCAAARSCADPAMRLWILYGRLADGSWHALATQCFGRPPTVADAPLPQVTPALVLEALRRLGLPAVEAKTQPADKTLVNFETIFYAEPETFSRTITLLGQQVDVEAVPTTYTWQHGDGTLATTDSPGAPYPATDITHVYTDAHRTVLTRVDVEYAAGFRVNGGAWQDIDETVTIEGPAHPLRISEATAVLSGQYE